MLQQETARDNVPIAALACAVLGFVSAIVMYWLVVPGLVLGLAAAVLGWFARRRGQRELGSVAITLGLVTMLVVPVVNMAAHDGEQWGRDCALDPQHDPNC